MKTFNLYDIPKNIKHQKNLDKEIFPINVNTKIEYIQEKKSKKIIKQKNKIIPEFNDSINMPKILIKKHNIDYSYDPKTNIKYSNKKLKIKDENQYNKDIDIIKIKKDKVINEKIEKYNLINDAKCAIIILTDDSFYIYVRNKDYKQFRLLGIRYQRETHLELDGVRIQVKDGYFYKRNLKKQYFEKSNIFYKRIGLINELHALKRLYNQCILITSSSKFDTKCRLVDGFYYDDNKTLLIQNSIVLGKDYDKISIVKNKNKINYILKYKTRFISLLPVCFFTFDFVSKIETKNICKKIGIALDKNERVAIDKLNKKTSLGFNYLEELESKLKKIVLSKTILLKIKNKKQLTELQNKQLEKYLKIRIKFNKLYNKLYNKEYNISIDNIIYEYLPKQVIHKNESLEAYVNREVRLTKKFENLEEYVKTICKVKKVHKRMLLQNVMIYSSWLKEVNEKSLLTLKTKSYKSYLYLIKMLSCQNIKLNSIIQSYNKKVNRMSTKIKSTKMFLEIKEYAKKYFSNRIINKKLDTSTKVLEMRLYKLYKDVEENINYHIDNTLLHKDLLKVRDFIFDNLMLIFNAYETRLYINYNSIVNNGIFSLELKRFFEYMNGFNSKNYLNAINDIVEMIPSAKSGSFLPEWVKEKLNKKYGRRLNNFIDGAIDTEKDLVKAVVIMEDNKKYYNTLVEKNFIEFLFNNFSNKFSIVEVEEYFNIDDEAITIKYDDVNKIVKFLNKDLYNIVEYKIEENV